MSVQKPTAKELIELIGNEKYSVWTELCAMINNLYDMDITWNNGGKAWKYEHKYRRGGKTLCTLYVREDCFGFMIIFGKDERQIFEANLSDYSEAVQKVYNDSITYHDGKRMMFEPTTNADISILRRCLP